nr:hypothetical protein CFP56_62138 [Quercus suber]
MKWTQQLRTSELRVYNNSMERIGSPNTELCNSACSQVSKETSPYEGIGSLSYLSMMCQAIYLGATRVRYRQHSAVAERNAHAGIFAKWRRPHHRTGAERHASAVAGHHYYYYPSQQRIDNREKRGRRCAAAYDGTGIWSS